jgi:hypothetical protein
MNTLKQFIGMGRRRSDIESVSSYHTARSLNENDATTWKALRERLESSGITSEKVANNLDLICSSIFQEFVMSASNSECESEDEKIASLRTTLAPLTDRVYHSDDPASSVQRYLHALPSQEGGFGSVKIAPYRTKSALAPHLLKYSLLPAICRPVKRGHGTHAGFIYLLTIKDTFEYTRIGTTTCSPYTRLAQLRKFWPYLLECEYQFEFEATPNLHRVERLIHMELGSRRVKMTPRDSQVSSLEWFEIPGEYAKRVLKKWVDWIRTGPYEINEGGIEVLKNPTEHIRLLPLCEPLDY